MTSEPLSLLPFALMAIVLTTATLAFVLRPLFRRHVRVVLTTCAAALLLAPLLYLRLGAVRALEDGPVWDAASVASARAVADAHDDLVAHLAHNPRDSRGWVLLARLELVEDRFANAAAAFERALTNPKAAADTTLWCEYAEALALAEGGRLAGRPREIVERALARDPKHRQALEMAGTAAAEAGQYDIAASHWRTLLGEFPEGSRERRELGAALSRIEMLATVDLH